MVPPRHAGRENGPTRHSGKQRNKERSDYISRLSGISRLLVTVLETVRSMREMPDR